MDGIKEDWTEQMEDWKVNEIWHQQKYMQERRRFGKYSNVDFSFYSCTLSRFNGRFSFQPGAAKIFGTWTLRVSVCTEETVNVATLLQCQNDYYNGTME